MPLKCGESRFCGVLAANATVREWGEIDGGLVGMLDGGLDRLALRSFLQEKSVTTTETRVDTRALPRRVRKERRW